MIRHTTFFRAVLPLAVAALAACDNPVAHDDHDDHFEPDEVAAIVITAMDGTTIATWQPSAWTFAAGSSFQLEVGQAREVRIVFVLDDGDEVQLSHEGAEHTLSVVVEDTNIAAYDGHGDHGDFEGLAAGQTTAHIEVFHGSHADFIAQPGMPIEVTGN